MVFSSIIFLFMFLPAVLVIYLLAGMKLRNMALLLASLFFYAWGETIYVVLMLFSITTNYFYGLWIHNAQQKDKSGRPIVVFSIITNFGMLAFFKYANFFADNLNLFLSLIGLSPVSLSSIHLPIGISFFTFQAISYTIDLYRKDAFLQKNPINIALYISLFPQLIAGPIIRYHDVAGQIINRSTRMDDLVYGVKRFIIGLGKKVLIANIVGRVADHVFSLSPDILPAHLAWLGIVSYTIQIYFDFSGYSDMAIGLGRMFGFHFLENFNYPYISLSIREFWKRWHISLSSWFRDYLYFPLGGNRIGKKRTYFNLITVFFLCGLWHGASWTFIFWGLYHGFFLVIERTAFGRFIARLPNLFRHVYALIVVVVGWVFFRSDTLPLALGYLKAMIRMNAAPYYDANLFLFINSEFYWVIFFAILGSGPFVQMIESSYERFTSKLSLNARWVSNSFFAIIGNFIFISILVLSIADLMGGAHNPFLYFRF